MESCVVAAHSFVTAVIYMKHEKEQRTQSAEGSAGGVA